MSKNSTAAQVDEIRGMMVDNVDKMLNNMERSDDLDSSSKSRDSTGHTEMPAYTSRATQLRQGMETERRHRLCILCCFFPTCGFCCGTCLPK
jgi:hypothetical protein